MLFTLGSRAQFGDVVDLLVACHHRIREHLALARRLAHAPAGTTPDSIKGAAARVRTYFDQAFPLHRADEEGDLFPLLVGRSDELDVAIGELMRDHETHEIDVRIVVDICRTLEQDPSQLERYAARLASSVGALETELVQHLALEERTVFPALTLLTSNERQQIQERMRKRRELASARS